MAWPLATLAAALSALIQVEGEPLQAGRIRGQARLPLQRAPDGDTPLVPLRTATGAPLRLLLDTGATSTMLTPAAAERLGLRPQPIPAGSFGLSGAGDRCRQPLARAVLPSLTIASRGQRLELDGAEALVLPVAGLPPGVDGVLGAPVLRQLAVWVDPPGAEMAFGAAAVRAAAAAAAAPATTLVALRWHRGVPLLSLPTPAATVPALVDTGAEGLFITAELAGRLPTVGPGRPVRIAGFCGLQPARSMAVLGLAGALQGQASWAAGPPRTAIVTRNPIFKDLGVQAIVGQELLRNRRQLWRLDRDPPHLELH